MKKILVTGAFGLVGTDLVIELQKKFGSDSVIAMGRETIADNFEGILEQGDVRDKQKLEELIQKYQLNEIYHLAGLLERILTNMNGLY